LHLPFFAGVESTGRVAEPATIPSFFSRYSGRDKNVMFLNSGGYGMTDKSTYDIAVLPGDGIGPELTQEVIKALSVASRFLTVFLLILPILKPEPVYICVPERFCPRRNMMPLPKAMPFIRLRWVFPRRFYPMAPRPGLPMFFCAPPWIFGPMSGL
jgi:hypothetical protein